MRKFLITAELKDLEKQVSIGEISYSRMIEMLNEKANNYVYEKIKPLLVFAQNDMLRMTANAKLQKQSEALIGNTYNEGFHGGNVQAFDYVCKHLTNVLEIISDKHEVSIVKCDMCANEWVAVRPLGTETLECSKCGHNTFFENTGA